MWIFLHEDGDFPPGAMLGQLEGEGIVWLVVATQILFMYTPIPGK